VDAELIRQARFSITIAMCDFTRVDWPLAPRGVRIRLPS
jgi:hypothetical protein